MTPAELSAQMVGVAPEEPPLPLTVQAMMHFPTLPASMGNTARRASATIVYGGRKRFFTSGMGTSFRSGIGEAILENINPFSRFSSQRIFTNMDQPGAIGYTPFNLATIGNRSVNALAGRSETRLGRMIGRAAGRLGIQNRIAASVDRGGELFNAGMLSKISAGARLANMSDARFAAISRSGAVDAFLASAGSGLDLGAMYSTTSMSHRQAMSFSTFASGGRLGGFMGAARFGAVGTTGIAGEMAAITSSNTAARMGAQTAARWAEQAGLSQGFTARQAARQAARNLAGRGVGRLGSAVAVRGAGQAAVLAGARVGAMAVPGLNIAMTAWLAYDLARLAGTAISGIPKFAAEAYKSYAGGLRTGVMEQTYTDNEVNMTSRARGVQAIANSRLNARSVLGHEASAMHRHFG